ncbi:MAG: group 1 truncated hemoglobin [Deltaproteobacteria bacterium]
MFNNIKSLSIPLVFFLFVSFSLSGVLAQEQKEESLYKRLGGYDAIAAVTAQLFARMIENEQLGKYFIGLNTESKQKAQQLTVDFICKATGGPCLYLGENMKVAHTGLGITDSDWDVSVEILVGILDEFKVPEKEKGELLSMLSGLKGQIVEN